MPIKNVTPAKGAASKKSAAQEYQPRFRSDKPQPRSRGGRGNELVDNDDTARVAEQATTTQSQEDFWKRVPAAIEYLRKYNEYLEKLARNEHKKLTPMDAIRLMNRVHQHKEQVAALIKSPIEKIFDILRFTVVPEVFSDNEITTLTIEGIGRVNIMDDISVVMEGDDAEAQKATRQKFIDWLVEHELEDMVTQTINAQTLAAFVRRQLKARDGIKLPTDLLKINPVTRAQITRS